VTHSGPEDYYAFDFIMPVGSEVLAAREGVVAQVRDGTAEGLPWEERSHGNLVTILHSDGTFAMYGHLTPGIPVRVGQAVARGQPIARSGSTGYSIAPHLHFVVRARTDTGKIRAVPIRFSIPGRPIFEPEPLHHHGVLPPSKRTLNLTLDGKPVEDGEKPIPVPYGAEAALRVELVEPDGTVRDVTADGRMRYETMSPWNLQALEPGRIQATVTPGVDEDYGDRAMPFLDQSEALLFVYHGVPKDSDFGFARLTLLIEVPSEAKAPEAPEEQPPPEGAEPEAPEAQLPPEAAEPEAPEEQPPLEAEEPTAPEVEPSLEAPEEQPPL
jgi:hypothetical protein